MTDERGLRRRPVEEVIVELTTQQWRDEDTIADLWAEIDRLRAIVNAQKANGGIRRDRHRLYGEVHRLKWELHRAVTANAEYRAVVEGLRTQLRESHEDYARLLSRWDDEREAHAALQVRVDAVKALHRDHHGRCAYDSLTWPCETIHALDSGLG